MRSAVLPGVTVTTRSRNGFAESISVRVVRRKVEIE